MKNFGNQWGKTMPKSNKERPEYIIQVHRNWRYGPRARFWDIMTWKEDNRFDEGGYWSKVTGGLAYTKLGMQWSINRRLKKMKFGYQDQYFNIDGSVFKGIK